MQSSTTLHGVSLRKKPRDGQLRVLNKIASADYLCVKLPTGYGKTFTACASYAIKQRQGINRLLFVFPTDAQLVQFVQDGPVDLFEAGVTGPHTVVDIRFSGIYAREKHRKNAAQVFAITIQSLCGSSGSDIVEDLLASCNWMIVVDEYHHYGIDKTWGKAVLALPYRCLLAMSATPYRPDDDSAFGRPDIDVKYTDAADEGAVKRLRGHSYSYAIDAILDDGDVVTYTTDELAKEAGGDTPEAIEKLRIQRRMRWSPKYISPLVSHPIERMLQQRLTTGLKLQAIVGAMCVSHAALVCEQIRALYPELSIDWVGTGADGKDPNDNREIISRFCPKKDELTGRRDPTLDVLVHVGMAGEGLDSVTVSEVIHLNRAAKNNSNDQENGRAARVCRGFNGEDVIGNINFDSSSEYAKLNYIGAAIMDAMDSLPARPPADDEPPEPKNSGDIPELPEEPTIQIFDMRLQNIDSGDPGVQLMLKVMESTGMQSPAMDFSAMHGNLDHPGWKDVISTYQAMRHKETEPLREPAIIAQWQDSIKAALSIVTSAAIKTITANGGRIEKSLPGDLKKKINSRKKRDCGALVENLDICKAHYAWLKRLDATIRSEGVPAWLW